MDSLELLQQARLAGLTVITAGDKLVVRGPRRLAPLAEKLLANKAQVLEALWLTSLSPDDLPIEWRITWDERAAIMEYDGGLPRERAEALALAYVIDQMKRVDIKRVDETHKNAEKKRVSSTVDNVDNVDNP